MIAVEVHGNFEKAVLMFRNRIGKEGLMTELKDREGFLTRLQRRKLKDRRAEIRKRKRERSR
jgi:ribosomal protein S21